MVLHLPPVAQSVEHLMQAGIGGKGELAGMERPVLTRQQNRYSKTPGPGR